MSRRSWCTAAQAACIWAMSAPLIPSIPMQFLVKLVQQDCNHFGVQDYFLARADSRCRMRTTNRVGGEIGRGIRQVSDRRKFEKCSETRIEVVLDRLDRFARGGRTGAVDGGVREPTTAAFAMCVGAREASCKSPNVVMLSEAQLRDRHPP